MLENHVTRMVAVLTVYVMLIVRGGKVLPEHWNKEHP